MASRTSDRPPLIARFRTPRARYVYDTNTNRFLRVGDVVYDVLADWGRIEEPALIAKYAPRHGAAAVRGALRTIRRCRARRRVFSSPRIEKLHFSPGRRELDRVLGGHLQQMILEITESCNLRCRYCVYSGAYRYQRTRSRRHMSAATARNAVDFFLAHSQRTDQPVISFFGGEPLVRAGLVRRLLGHLAATYPRRKLNLHLTTNGVLLTEENVRLLARHDVAMLVSLDGPRAVHDRMRVTPSGRGSFRAVLANLKAARRLFPEYYRRQFAFNITLWSPAQFNKAREFFADHPALFAGHKVLVNYVNPVDTTLWTDRVLPPWNGDVQTMAVKEYLDAVVSGRTPDGLVKEMCELPFVRIHLRDMRPLGKTLWPNGICIPGVRRLFCTTRGELTLCERINRGLSIGAVDAGIDREAVLMLGRDYARISSADCRDCWAVRLCTACFCQLHTDRFDLQRKRETCEGVRERLLKSMAGYCEAREKNEHAFNFMDRMRLG